MMTTIGKKICMAVLVILWGGMAFVSCNHLFSFVDLSSLSTTAMGCWAWFTFGATVCLSGAKHWKPLILIICFFFLCGYLTGPFLEPPADPLDHLRNTYATCGKTVDQLQRTNKGVWQYSMVGNFLCHEQGEVSPQGVLKRIDLANGTFWAMAAAILFLVGLRAGIPRQWAFFSVCVAFLFMGTSRFSYFRYYSFAPSFSSIWIYWLWISVFFFRKEVRFLIPGVFAAGLGLLIIVVNHIQEAIFLALICSVWVFLFLWQAVSRQSRENRLVWLTTGQWGFAVAVVFVFFVLPQWQPFQRWLAKFFLFDYWQANQEAVFNWHGIHLMGKIWEYRIADTLALFGFLPLLLIPFFIFPGFMHRGRETKWRVLFLGLLPLLVYCLPLLNFIWLANCVHLPTHIRYYYRMCYSGLFWLPLALVLYNVQLWFCDHDKPFAFMQSKWRKRLFFSFCLTGITVLSLVGSPPLYGKLDFLLVNSRSWWNEWLPMINRVLSWQTERVDTDYITGYVLHAVFNVRLKHNQFNLCLISEVPKRDIDTMIRESGGGKTGCLINLHGFEPTWVPFFTGHWSADLSRPALMYRVTDDAEGDIPAYLPKEVGNCYVYN